MDQVFNVDAKFLTNALDQAQLQKLADNIKDLIHFISRVPDLSGIDFSQNASDPIIKIKTKPLLVIQLLKSRQNHCLTFVTIRKNNATNHIVEFYK